MDRATRYTNIAYRWAGLIMLCVPVVTLGVLRYNQECTAGLRYDCTAVCTDATEYSISTMNYAQLRHWFKPNYHFKSAPLGSRLSAAYLPKTRSYDRDVFSNEVSDNRVDEWFVWYMRNWFPIEIVRITNPYMLSRWWDAPGLILIFWSVLAGVFYRQQILKYFMNLAEEKVKVVGASSSDEKPTYRHAPFRIPPQQRSFWQGRGLGYSVPLGFLIGCWMCSLGIDPVWSATVGAIFALVGSYSLASVTIYSLFCMSIEAGVAIWKANLMIGWLLMLAWVAVLASSVAFLLVLHRPNGAAERLTRGLNLARLHIWHRFIAFACGR